MLLEDFFPFRCLLILFFLTICGGQADISAQTLTQDTLRAAALLKEANSFYNQIPDDNNYTDRVLDHCQEIRKIYEKYAVKNQALAEAWLLSGIIYYYYKKDFQTAKIHCEHAARLIAPLKGQENLCFEIWRALGEIETGLYKYKAALHWYEKIDSLVTKHKLNVTMSAFYNSLSQLYLRIGDYHKALKYSEQAIEICEQNGELSPAELIHLRINMAITLRRMGKHEQSIQTYRQVIVEATRIHGRQSPLVVHLLFNLSRTYFYAGQYEQALEAIREAKTIHPKLKSSPVSLGYIHHAFAQIYLSTGKDELAETEYHQALAVMAPSSEANLLVNAVYLGLAQLEEKKQHYPQALAHVQKSLSAIHFSFNSTDIYRNPDDPSDVINRQSMLEVLQLKAGLLQKYHQQTRQQRDLEMAWKTYQSAILLIERTRKSYDSEEMKLFFTEKASPTYENALLVVFQLARLTGQPHYRELMLEVMEKNKAAVLASTLREVENKKYGGIPASLLTQEKALKLELAALSTRMADEHSTERIKKLKNERRQTELALEKLIAGFEKYPQYHRLKYDTNHITLPEVQQHLDSHTAMLEYFTGKEHGYALLITEDDFEVRQFAITPAYSAAISSLKTQLYEHQPYTTYSGNEAAAILFKTLVAPFAPQLEGKTKLAVVPDGQLNYIPFDVLVSDGRMRYLVYDYAICRAYSASLFCRQDQSGRQAPGSLLAVAPFASHPPADSLLPPLPASGQEAKDVIAGKEGADLLMGSAAAKDRFLAAYSRFDVLHLATHASAGDEKAFIAFYPDTTGNKLYIHELYNYPFDHTRLVVLSACETGAGKLVSGEGVISLARAFFYAGCPSIITTLWRADDGATSAIAVSLHNYLEQGYDKDEALRLAKVDYLQSKIHLQKEPYYWANFVLIGTTEPLHSGFAGKNRLWMAMAGLTVLLLAGGLQYRRRRK